MDPVVARMNDENLFPIIREARVYTVCYRVCMRSHISDFDWGFAAAFSRPYADSGCCTVYLQFALRLII